MVHLTGMVGFVHADYFLDMRHADGRYRFVFTQNETVVYQGDQTAAWQQVAPKVDAPAR